MSAFFFVSFEEDYFVSGSKTIAFLARFVCFFVGEEFFNVGLVEGFDVAVLVGGEMVEASDVYSDWVRYGNGLLIAALVPGYGLPVVAGNCQIPFSLHIRCIPQRKAEINSMYLTLDQYRTIPGHAFFKIARKFTISILSCNESEPRATVLPWKKETCSL